MPNHPTWLTSVPDILQILKQEHAPPFLDRGAIESLFNIRRRQAISLMHQFGGYEVGRAFLADRHHVIAFLEQRVQPDAIREIDKQKRQVSAFLGEARQALKLPSIPLPPPERLAAGTFAGLPVGIQLTQRHLSITFETATDLVEKLFALAQAFANDFEHLEEALAAPPLRSSEEDR